MQMVEISVNMKQEYLRKHMLELTIKQKDPSTIIKSFTITVPFHFSPDL